MPALLNRMIVGLLPLIPKALVKGIAGRYVAGEAISMALETTRDLNERGFQVTLDILGEHVSSQAEATDVTDAYRRLYGEIAAAGLSANISLKPSHLGLDLGMDVCRRNLAAVIDAARLTGNFLRIDMESATQTDQTLDLFRELLETYPNVGPVLQAYLYRSAADLETIMSPRLNVRVCKGIYRESPDIAIQDREAINENYLALVRQGLDGGAYVAIATHDLDLIGAAQAMIRELATPTSRFEFQVLFGVPMRGRLESLLADGCTVRIYVPFGEAWYNYGLRRLKENPAIAGYVLKDLFNRNG